MNKDNNMIFEAYMNKISHDGTPSGKIFAFVDDLSNSDPGDIVWDKSVKQFILDNKHEILQAMDSYDWSQDVIDLFTELVGPNDLRLQN